MTAKYLWEILVPTVRPDKPGRYFTTRFHLVWDEKVRKISKGLTIFKPAHGEWVAPDGELFRERMIPVRVFCTPGEIELIANLVASHYSQKAVMFYRVSDLVKIKHFS